MVSPQAIDTPPHARYFLIVFVLSCAVLIGYTAAIYQQSQARRVVNDWVLHSYQVIQEKQQLLAALIDAHDALQDYTLLGPKAAGEHLDTAATAVRAQFAALQQSVSDNPAQEKTLAAAKAQTEQYLQAAAVQLRSPEMGRVSPAAERMARSTLTSFIQARDALTIFSKGEDVLLQQRLASQTHNRGTYLTTLIMGAALGLGILVIANIFVFTLVTRNTNSDAELRRSEARFSLIMNGINDGIFEHDLDHGTSYFSGGYKAMLGYSEEDFPTSTAEMNNFLHPDDRNATWQAYQDYLARQAPIYNATFRMQRKDGRWVWVLSRGVAVWDADGHASRFVGTHTDITAQREREEELRQLNMDLEGFTYIASHDLRSPLVNLKGFAGEIKHSLEPAMTLLTTAAPEPSPARDTLTAMITVDIPEALGFINAAVTKMDKLTNAVLELSRIGRRDYHHQPVDMNALVDQSLKTIGFEITQNKIAISRSDLPVVVCDPFALEQIFGNMLDNAVKYLDPQRPGVISIKALTTAQDVIFTINDNGRGIAASDQGKVFDIFRRASNSADVRGSGMGMAFVKATVRRLGGKIWFESKLDAGTTFFLSLPLTQSLNEVA